MAPAGSSAPRGEAVPLGAQPRPRVLERAASKAAHFPALALTLTLTLTLSLTLTLFPRQVVSVGKDCCICVWNFFGE